MSKIGVQKGMKYVSRYTLNHWSFPVNFLIDLGNTVKTPPLNIGFRRPNTAMP